jgi:DNA-directed RNA polymerase subunit A"
MLTETFSTPEDVDPSPPTKKFDDGTDAYETIVDLEDFMDAITVAHISLDRYADLVKRAAIYYPEYVIRRPDGTLKLKRRIPGKIVASIVFPREFNWQRVTKTNERLELVEIENGMITRNSGPLCKKCIGATSYSAIHPLWKYNPDLACQVISELQAIASVLITRIGFSMGISDCLTTDPFKANDAINKALIECEIVNSSLEKTPEEKERAINGILNGTTSVAAVIAKTCMNKGDRNALVMMKKAGAKGSDMNVMQITSFVGQQNKDGKRAAMTLSGGTRTLPNFFPGDNSPVARGFVTNSYLKGLSPSEAWFHAMTGRRGVVDTAMKTADTGYMQKRMVQKEGDLRVEYDGSVRDAAGSIVQFIYGGDGINAKELIKTRNLQHLFFMDPFAIASTLNSIACYEETDQNKGKGPSKGELRELNKNELDLLLGFLQAGSPGVQTEVTERVTYNVRLCTKIALKGVKVYTSVIPRFCLKVKDEFESAKAKKGYMPGLIAASSVGEPTMQLSELGSEKIPLLIVEKTGEKIFLLEPIGEVIDVFLERRCKIIYHHDKEGKSISSNPEVDVYVYTVHPTTSKTSWQKVIEISRHPANGGMVKVTTRSGRSTTTTLSHSHLRREPETGNIIPVRGDELKKGDRIPVLRKMNFKVWIKELVVRGKNETVTYPLDFGVGWLFGAYLSEGNVQGGQIGITNVSDEFETRCHEFALRFGGNVRRSEIHKANFAKAGYDKKYLSVTNHISGCSDLGRYLVKVCGYGSANKHIPAFALFAPKEFVSGLLRGYFDGDGNVDSGRQQIRVHSISRDLIETIALLLARFGIFGTINVEKPDRKYPLFVYGILKKHAALFLEHIGTDMEYKRKGMQEIVDYNNRDGVVSLREDIDLIPSIGHSISEAAKPLKLPGYSRLYKRHEKKPATGRETTKKYYELFASNGATGKHMDILKTAVESDILWDEIVKIEILDDPDEMVYDLGVAGNHTFMMQSGIFTHNTLNTFHHAGISDKDVTLGVPRYKELLGTTHNPSKPSITIHLLDRDLKDKAEKIRSLESQSSKQEIEKLELETMKKATTLANPFTRLTVDQVAKRFTLQYIKIEDDDGKRIVPQASPIGMLKYREYQERWWVKFWRKLGNAPLFEPLPRGGWVIIITLDIDKLYDFSITPADIAKKIELEACGVKGPTLTCIPSPLSIGEIEVYINFDDIDAYIETKSPLETEGRSLVTYENLDYFTAREVAIDLIKKTVIQGIPGITKTFVKQDGITKERSIDTQGTNLAPILSTPGVDTTLTVSDDMWEMHKIFGIEVARNFLIKEMYKIISFDGASVDLRHVSILVDEMCRTGTITSVSRDGISRTSPTAKLMFEKTVDNATESAVFCEHDTLSGCSGSILMGCLIPAGTGTVSIKDPERMPVERKI